MVRLEAPGPQPVGSLAAAALLLQQVPMQRLPATLTNLAREVGKLSKEDAAALSAEAIHGSDARCRTPQPHPRGSPGV